MGVIKKNDSKVGLFSPASEDSLQIAQSDDELSIASVSTDVSANIPQPEPRQRNYPKPMSFHNTRRRMGKKQSRRHDNALLLETLVEESEVQEITLQDLMQNPSPGFSRLFEGDNMENTRVEQSESKEWQKKRIPGSAATRASKRIAYSSQSDKPILKSKTSAARSFPGDLLTSLNSLPNIRSILAWYMNNVILDQVLPESAPVFMPAAFPLHGELQKWYDFMESSEEVQKKIIEHSPKKRSCPSDPAQDSAGKEFQRIKSGCQKHAEEISYTCGNAYLPRD